MTAFSVTHTFSAGTKAKAAEVNTNFDDLVDQLNASGLADGGTPGDLIICDASGNPIQQTATGPVTIDDDGATQIAAELDTGSGSLSSGAVFANIAAVTLVSGFWIVWGSIYVDAVGALSADTMYARLVQDLTVKDSVQEFPCGAASLAVGPELMVVSGSDVATVQAASNAGGTATGRIAAIRIA